ncbi:UDP-glucose 4-epimerase [Cyphellophora attinorum]|uniref:UDP-glucose 4-epimerase n=1 Tax=Cyphellophora attinorum TaxID=1664694 RepID=A0A0N0NS73_9EURO|nr:UDP-glucose 4-epimerase [Phialophora attinorum]KPI45921.1 UDP-glucose 4-epimerase [Phialophora attinorum]
MSSTYTSRAASPSASYPGTPATERSVLFDNVDLPQYILVTGGLGFIGSHTAAELLKSGYNVLIVDNCMNSHRRVFDRIVQIADNHYADSPQKRPDVKLFDISYQDIPAMQNLLDQYTSWSLSGDRQSSIIGVIHFAALKAVEESIRMPLKYYRNNINGLIDFLSLLDEYNVKKFIFSSSATVYGTVADRGLPVREESCVHKPTLYQDKDSEQLAEQGCTGLTNPYGRTKFFGEAILADLAASDPSWTILALRYFNPIGCDESGLIGEDPKGVPSNLLPVVTKVMTGEYAELKVFGDDWNTPDGTAIRDFIHVTDLARGHIAALSTAQGECLKENFRTFNLGTGTGYSVEQVASTMETVSGRPVNRRKVERRAGDVGTCVAVADRARVELGWETQKSLNDACRDICNFLELNKS